MNNETLTKLDFYTIIEEVKKRAIGEYTKERITENLLQTNLEVVKQKLTETTEARLIIDSGQHVPFMGLVRIKQLMSYIEKGLTLQPNELLEFADFLRSGQLIQKFFEKNRYQTPTLYHYAQTLNDFSLIETSIYEKIQNQKINDAASKNLRRIRNQIRQINKEIEDRLQKFLKHSSNKLAIQEKIIVKKSGAYTIPIKAAYKNKIAGTVIDESKNGQTVFIEPTAITKLNEQLAFELANEAAEEYQILAELTSLIFEKEYEVSLSIESITAFDLIFARAKYSREIDGQTPIVDKNEEIDLIDARHPSLGSNAVPIQVKLGKDYRGLVITGANAGGKTLVLKTVGLLTLMAMFGLQIPAKKESKIAVFDQVFVDIGDAQDVSNALSTFSGHIQNVAAILQKAKRHTLVLLDEIGSGTEPNEGAGLAIAILEKFYQKGALQIVTTHYGEIKRFSQEHEDFIPAAMAFDKENLQPLYHLIIGQTGESQALWIAKKMNMEKEVLLKAAHYIKQKEYGTQKVTFENRQPVAKNEKEKIIYQQGDRVILNETGEIALIYLDDEQDFIQVFLNEEVIEVPRKRVKLEQAAANLYPQDYNMESLFVDFHERKWKKDLDRGSKKAHKILRKEALARKV
jgi:dsDNA-specific endonuclease/ATPase MutS2